MAEPSVLVWEVSALVHAVGDALAARFSSVVVRGEISGFSRAASGHCYFTLKDAEGAAAIRCAMFRRAASLLDFAPRDGLQVELRGRVAVYEARGELQLVAEGMRQAGAGALMEQFLRLKAKLEAEGLFDPARRRPLPAFPRHVGVVTSLQAAALRDVLSALRRRAPHVQAIVYPAPVQGAEAPALLAQAIAQAGARNEVDALIVCRGGGSLEDLWAFNTEPVVRAIVASPMPVVSGVGHETDVTLADFAADLRAPTPTAAAELVAPRRDDCLQLLARSWRLLHERVVRVLDQQELRIDHAADRLARPAQAVSVHRARIALLAQRRTASAARALQAADRRLELLQRRFAAAIRLPGEREGRRLAVLRARLQALAPDAVLARGYAWIGSEDGRPIVSVRGVQPGQGIVATLADGRVRSTVVEVTLDPSTDPAPMPPTPAGRRGDA